MLHRNILWWDPFNIVNYIYVYLRHSWIAFCFNPDKNNIPIWLRVLSIHIAQLSLEPQHLTH